MRAENPESTQSRASFGTDQRPSGRTVVRRSRPVLVVLNLAVVVIPVLVAVLIPALAVGTPDASRTGPAPLATSMVNKVVELAAAEQRVAPSTSGSVTSVPTTVAPPTTEAPATTASPTSQAPSTTVVVTAPPTTAAPPPPPPPPPPPAPVQTAPGIPADSYWDRMAQCETAGNWAHYPNGTYTGGLGIYNQTWLAWGGGEFAPKAGQATKAQQIIVANRIAVTGHNGLGPVGFSAWGCMRTIGAP